jgi:hypothetical protein
MVIETGFRYNQISADTNVRNLDVTGDDLLGPLKAFIGDNQTRTWSGPGFNMIWRPHDKSGDNNQDFFLELDVTKETLSFTNITGDGGIANRGLLQTDIALGGLAYQQEVSDVTRTPTKKLHFEPGVWINIPATINPAEPEATVARMGSIPHGTTIHAQGKAFLSPDGRPHFISPVSIMPFRIGSPDDGVTGIVPFPEGKPPIATAFPARTPSALAVGLDDTHFADVSKILSDVTDRQTIKSTTVYVITTELAAPSAAQAPNPGVPNVGGGTDNIAFLVGSGGGPNAVAARMTATFWVEELEIDGNTVLQLQYIQRVLLNFNGLSWPHVSLATMVVVDEK